MKPGKTMPFDTNVTESAHAMINRTGKIIEIENSNFKVIS